MPNNIPVFTCPEGEREILKTYEAVLDRWPISFNETMVPTSFGETHVIISGPVGAPPVVLLHALLATATSWYQNVEALSGSYRVFAVDVIGEANKSRPVRPITSLDDFLQWFTELIDALGIKTLCLAGNSYGGFTAAYYAMKLPERIKKLVLIGPAATIQPMIPFYIHMFIPKAIYGFFPKTPGIKGVMRGAVDWMQSGLPCDPFWEPLFYRTMVYGGLINQVFPRVYTKAEFAQIKAPVLLILGDKEVIYGHKSELVAKAARDLIPGLQTEIIEGAHHITALAKPDRVNQLILEFFAN